VKSLDCLTLTIVVIGGLNVAAAPSAWATDTKKNAPAPAPAHAAPPPAKPAQPAHPVPQTRPSATTAGHPNPAVPHPAAGKAPARPAPAVHPAAKPQKRPAEPRGTAASSVHPEHPRRSDPSRPSERHEGMAAGGQPRLNERIRDPAREHEAARLHEHDFHTKDVRRFDVREREHWRTGRWHNDFHSGRFGWWYEVDDVWYAYPAPVFPYPLVVAPIIVEEAVGPVAYDQAPPAAPAGFAPLPPLPKAAYHCGNPEGFFPVVDACSVEWVTVNAH
jgi:hypothetical protein